MANVGYKMDEDFKGKLSKLSELLKLKKETKKDTKSTRSTGKRARTEYGEKEDMQFESRLNYWWFRVRGGAGEKAVNPWTVAPFNEHLLYRDDLPTCQHTTLVFGDLARELPFVVNRNFMDRIISTALGTTVMSPVVFVFVMYPGNEVSDLVALTQRGYTGYKVQTLYGTCEFLDRSETTKKGWYYTPDAQVVYQLLTSEEDEYLPDPWVKGLSKNAKETRKVDLNVRVDTTRDIDLVFPVKKPFPQETKEEKAQRMREKKEVHTLQCASRYPDGNGKMIVNRYCKSRFMCSEIIKTFSNKNEFVLDFFSGGVFMREALLHGRQCLAFGANERETSFLQDYPHALVDVVDNKHVLRKYMDSWTKTQSAPSTSTAYKPISVSDYDIWGAAETGSPVHDLDDLNVDMDILNDPEAHFVRMLNAQGNDEDKEDVAIGEADQVEEAGGDDHHDGEAGMPDDQAGGDDHHDGEATRVVKQLGTLWRRRMRKKKKNVLHLQPSTRILVR
ncbi:hypothetical protein R1sor_002462 [Riccia sorocarpa]|uniref:Uncharacterized protein n=1 Tax=Riccia sorocarpa TaxID=122646 RepID=A0ABD3H213_9MARC